MAPRFVAHAALLGALALLGGFALGSSERAPPRVSAASVRSPSAGAEAEMDDGLYSRQLLTIGRDAQLRVSQSRVLVTGLRGTGVEVAKNLILAGVRAVTLHDDAPVGWADLAANYCLEEAHVGKPRAACVRHALASLNPEHVEVDVHHGALTAAQLAAANVTVLVAADLDHAEEVRLNALCRLAGVRFVGACGRGVFGRIFCDFGRGDDDEFVVEDTDGEPAREVHIQELRVDGTVELAEASGPHGLARGDFVTFSNVEGLEHAGTTQSRLTTGIGHVDSTGTRRRPCTTETRLQAASRITARPGLHAATLTAAKLLFNHTAVNVPSARDCI
ncbi:hypothetical protein T492DRAFT_849015 [Pavlovales sp. CCMP2436]|nr:hypothetical protein T492DRAFT_849015 [Pavlovales sp. CCMP2436]